MPTIEIAPRLLHGLLEIGQFEFEGQAGVFGGDGAGVVGAGSDDVAEEGFLGRPAPVEGLAGGAGFFCNCSERDRLKAPFCKVA